MPVHAAHETEDLNTTQTHSFWIIYWSSHSFRKAILPLFTISYQNLPSTIYSAHEGPDEDTWTQINTPLWIMFPPSPSSPTVISAYNLRSRFTNTDTRCKSTKLLVLNQVFRSELVGLCGGPLYRRYYSLRGLQLPLQLAQLYSTIASAGSFTSLPRQRSVFWWSRWRSVARYSRYCTYIFSIVLFARLAFMQSKSVFFNYMYT